MKSSPILFSAPMVRAILDGRKSMTRRIVKGVVEEPGVYLVSAWEQGKMPKCPYGSASDRLWVRETFYIDHVDWLGRLPSIQPPETADAIYYAADGTCCQQIPECGCAEVGKPRWRPSIFMPRWASRITLEITDVKVERLQDISEDDAKSEGAIPTYHELYRCPRCGYLDHDDQDGTGHWEQGTSQHSNDKNWSYWTLRCNGCGEVSDMPLASAKEHFQHLWKAINGAGSWDANPWVWAISFKRIGGGA